MIHSAGPPHTTGTSLCLLFSKKPDLTTFVELSLSLLALFILRSLLQIFFSTTISLGPYDSLNLTPNGFLLG